MNASTKFVASYSGGKDSFLAVARAIESGMQPASLLTTFRTDRELSCFHGISRQVLQRVSESLDIPLHIMPTTGDAYTQNFEDTLTQFKHQGVEACVFGDIDVLGHLEWCTERCQNVGMQAVFPLWGESRKTLVYEFIDRGFRAMITVVDTSRLSETYIGQTLTRAIVDRIESDGVDICGENGEYHTFVYGGSLFRTEPRFAVGAKHHHGNYVSLMIE